MQRDGPSSRRVLYGVVQQVDEDLFQPTQIGKDARGAGEPGDVDSQISFQNFLFQEGYYLFRQIMQGDLSRF